MPHQTAIGVIGGSGLYEMEGLEDIRAIRLDTPFGEPSDEYISGELNGIRLVFLPRHGRGHRLLPSEVNYRANIYGMKKLGVRRIISVSAVGSLKEAVVPGHIVIPDQFIDRTRGTRDSTFFGNGIVAHVGFADPTCHCLSDSLFRAAQRVGAITHKGGTYICMEGPAFSTRAESFMYRSLGGDVIGMTNLTEAKLAREAEICYGVIALSTDYDCWHDSHEDVTVDAILAIMHQNVATAKEIIRQAAADAAGTVTCRCGSSLATAIVTDRALIPDETKQKLELLIGNYV